MTRAHRTWRCASGTHQPNDELADSEKGIYTNFKCKPIHVVVLDLIGRAV